MAHCTIKTPDVHINDAFERLTGFLNKYKIGPECKNAWAPGVLGYGIDEQCPRTQDTRDNRWLVWAARYCEPDDEFLRQITPSILRAAFSPDGQERHEIAAPSADDYLHHYVWWLLQVALGYLYTGDTSLDVAQIKRIVETTYRKFDQENVGMPHTLSYYFVTSIGEPVNTDPGQAYGFFPCCNLAFSLKQFAALADERGDVNSKKYFEEKLDRLLSNIQTFRSSEGFYYALKDKATGTFRYRVIEPEAFSLMVDNIFFPLVFGVLSQADLQPSLDYLLSHIRDKFPVLYAYPSYRGEGSMAWWFPRSWQECLTHYCLGLREMEMPSLLYDAIKRQVDRIVQDNEVWEHYDPETGVPEGYHPPARRGYSTTSACLNIAIIEGLFGIRPEKPGFASVSIKPAFPEVWTSASIDTTVNGLRIAYSMSSSDRRVVHDFGLSSNIHANLILPLPKAWPGTNVQANVDGTVRLMKGEERLCFTTSLPLRSLRIELEKRADEN